MQAKKKSGKAKSSGKSRITNGTRLVNRTASKVPLSHVDGRSIHMRRFRDLLSIHISDLGGETNTSEAERSLCRRAATITVMLERIEFEMALTSGDVSAFRIDQYQRLSGTLNRLLKTIGLKRISKDVTPSLSDYLRQKAAEREAQTIDHDDDEDDAEDQPRVINGKATTQRVRARP